MGHAHTVKYLIWMVLGFHLIAFLGGCNLEDEAQKAKEEARGAGEHAVSDSPGWARLRQQEALPPKLRDKPTPPADIDASKISREWPDRLSRPTPPASGQ
jgi:hypothetical protein